MKFITYLADWGLIIGLGVFILFLFSSMFWWKGYYDTPLELLLFLSFGILFCSFFYLLCGLEVEE